MSQSPHYETHTFDPRCAFSWTLRGGEMARVEAQQQRSTHFARSARYETRTFDPRGAFSWTLRSGEIAGRERRHLLSNPKQSGVLVAS